MVSVKSGKIRHDARQGSSSKLDNTDEPFTLAHLSDLHMFSPQGISVRDLFNKRVFGYLIWHLRRRAEHRGEVLAALQHDLRCVKPNHIAVTGDLTHLGLPNEFRKAEELLLSMGLPSQVTVVPGNHDVYVATDWDRTFAHWADYMASDTVQLRGCKGANFCTGFPILRVRGWTAIIGVSTARPSALFLATGAIGQLQLQALEQILVATGQQRLFRVVLIHHPPVPGTVPWRKRLTDAAAFRAVLKQHGAELVLHGHAHRTSLTRLETARGMTPTIGVPSGSAIGRKKRRRARYHVYRLKPKAHAWDVLLSVRRYSPAENRFIAERETRLTVARLLS